MNNNDILFEIVKICDDKKIQGSFIKIGKIKSLIKKYIKDQREDKYGKENHENKQG